MTGGVELHKKNKNQIIDAAVFAVLLAVCAGITFTLFYHQCIYNMQDSGMYHADMKAYILEMQGLDSGYSFPYPIMFKLAALIHLFAGPELSMAVAVTFLNCLAMAAVKIALNKMTLTSFEKVFSGKEWLAGVCISLISLSLFFVSMLFPPPGIYLPGIKFNYLGVFTPNPLHNATYMAARPFAVPAFLWCAKLLETYERKAGLRDYILFSLFLLLSTMAKPSFTIVLVGTAGLIMLYRLLRQKCHNIKETIYFGLAFIPTFIDLLYQFKGVFVPEEGAEGGIGFCLGTVWRFYCDNIPLAVCLAAGFPILVLVLHFGQLKTDTLYRLSWQMFGMSFVMAFFLYEKGFREMDFNFSWGYMYGIFFAFFGALAVLIKATAKREKPLLLAMQWGAYLWHLLCGLYYFFGIFQGKMYY